MPPDTFNPDSTLLAERYRLERRIGAGAHATTWLAFDERLDRPVAVKFLRKDLADDPVFVQRFTAEAKAAASVRQTNVVDVYDFGQHNGQLFIIMQYVDGEDLKSLIDRESPVHPRRAARIIDNVLDGLEAIHRAGIVHRDIKPQNVLIGHDGLARVTDFGVADTTRCDGLTTEGFTIGTVDYMAPEQAQGLPLTAAADLYSTGVVLYELLTGTLPFRGETSRDVMLAHINGQLVPPSVRLPGSDIGPMLDAVVAQAMAKEPGRRFASAQAMKKALAQAMSSNTGQHTTMMAHQVPPPRPIPAPSTTYSAVPAGDEVGSGLNRAFVALIILLVIGAMGVAAWGGFQLLDREKISLPFDIPFISRDTPTEVPQAPVETVPAAAPEQQQEPAPIEPVGNQQIPPPEPVASDPPVEDNPTVPPAQDEDVPLIEPVEGESPTEEPPIEGVPG